MKILCRIFHSPTKKHPKINGLEQSATSHSSESMTTSLSLPTPPPIPKMTDKMDVEEKNVLKSRNLVLHSKIKTYEKKPKVVLKDRDPNRIVNPLLETPQYPPLPKGVMPGSLPVPMIPNGAELWNICNIYFAKADTFPISYYARILGFDVPQMVQETNCY